MANATVRLPITLTNQIRQSEPYTVYKITDNAEYQISKNSAGNVYGVLGKIAKMPQALRHNVLVGVSLKIFMHNSGYTYGIRTYAYFAVSYDPETVNYNNRPDAIYSFATKSIPSGTSVTDITYEEPTDSVDALRSCRYNIYFYVNTGNDSGPLFTRAVLTDGVTAPYVEIIYDDTVKITSKISYTSSQLSGTVNPAEAKTLTWDLVKDTSSATGYCAEEKWEQVSAEFRYRIQGESTWQTISVTGTTKGVTIPAYTFATGNTYEYQISVTDEDGTTSETSVYTFTTPATKVTPSGSPTSGYVNPRSARSFGWYYGSSAGTVSSGNTTLHWRVSGESSWNDVAAAQGADSLTIPANTFPAASTIEWYLSGTDSTGYASQTSVYSFSTSAGRVTATPVSPISTVESNNEEITLTWTYSSADGFAPSRFVLYWKLITDDSWTVLTDSATAATSYTAPANTFTAGEIQWYVLPYNIDGVVGSGDSASFIAYGAPEAPVVSAEAIPYTTVSWQATGQEAYEVQVDGDTYGPYFGTEKQFELPEKLEDGQHTIRVRIIGNYGLWSQYGTAVITVENQPGAEIVLTGTAGTDAALSWTTAASETDFLIYRDDVQIGHTAQTAFTDRLAVGEHRYYIVNRLQSGNYSKSNELTLESVADGTFIAEKDGGEWLEIKYSKKDTRDPEYEVSADGSFYHLAGDEWPSGSLSGYKESKVIFSALFFREQETERKQFESLLGKAVILKFRDGTVFQTVLDNWKKEMKKLIWTAYSFTLRRIEWEDYTDDTE